jgi:hypothetical protein
MGKMMVWLDSTPVVLTRMITFGLTKPHFGGVTFTYTPHLSLSPEGKLSCPATIKLKMNKNRTKLKIHGQPFK